MDNTILYNSSDIINEWPFDQEIVGNDITP